MRGASLPFLLAGAFLPAHSVNAQQNLEDERIEGQPPQRIDILSPPPSSDPDDPVAAERCDGEADAARVAGEILVCRDLGKSTDGSYDHEEFMRRYAEETQGPSTPDVDRTGLPPGMAPIVTIRGCFIPPCPKDPAILIDVEGLPIAPKGSDADRIARGLPPLGEDGDEGRGPVDEDELGLPPPLKRRPADGRN